MRLVIGITGASGVVYGIRLLRALKTIEGVEAHLIVSDHAALTMRLEHDIDVRCVKQLADVTYAFKDIGAAVSSGSFKTGGMVVLPCSVKTLSGIVNSYDDNLIVRAADVTLKERRPLVLAVRETPLHLGHLRLMTAASEMGATIFPPVPAFYTRPKALDDIIDQTVGRILDQVGVDTGAFQRWGPGSGTAAYAKSLKPSN